MSDLDFDGLAREMLRYAREFLPAWLPGGKMSGHEYVCGSLRGEEGRSLSVNVNTGAWADFASDARGGDLISLYAAIEGIKQGEAAKRLARDINFALVAEKQKEAPKQYEAKIAKPPKDTPPPSMKLSTFGAASMRWCYRDSDGEPLFWIARYDPPNSRKQFVPWCWDQNGNRWIAKAWPLPRPLYGLDRLSADKERPVMVVEGEKACDAARTVINAYVVVTWPGGAKAVSSSDFTPLYGRRVLLWPDADEPGRAAMGEVAKRLVANCVEVKIIDTAGQSEGWDAADAIGGGWKWEQFAEWAKARVKVATGSGVPVEAQVIPPTAPETEPEESDDDIPVSTYGTWEQLGIATTKSGSPICNVDNALRVLEGWKGLNNLVWFDTFHQKILTRWKSELPREWSDIDDLNLVQMFQRKLQLVRMSDDMVNKAIRVYAHARKRNEPRDWMESLTWDQKPRIDTFLSECFGCEDTPYTRAVSRNFWIGMAARTFRPGCKLDNMMILEGAQGKFKSSALALIGGPWFAEVQGAGALGRELYLILQGKLLVEIGEMAAFSKAEVTAVKQVVSCQNDRYRSPYGRAAEDHPRMNIFVGTTNESEYLRDNTGARRFWPVKIGLIDKARIAEQRNQLFAEAVVRFKRGENWYEMPAEATVLEQENRRQVDEWEDIIEQYLIGKDKVQIADIAAYLKIEASKLGLVEQRRIAGILRLLQWERTSAREDGRVIRVWLRNDGTNHELPLDEEKEPF